MKKILLGFVLVSFNANAFHAVTEILPGGQFLICKDYGQIKKGNVVENHVREEPKSEQNVKTIKKDEFSLPGIGGKFTLYHRDFQTKLRSLTTLHEKELGRAVIIDAQTLVGTERIIRSSSNTLRGGIIETSSVISKEDALAIDNNCVVAVTENNLVLDEMAAVVW